MSVLADQRKIIAQLRFYSAFLKTVSEDGFRTTPKAGGWSYAELYAHVLDVNFHSLVAIENCLNKTASVRTKQLDWRVRLILFLGRFPPGKYKVPAQLEAAVSKISREAAANELIRLMQKVERIAASFASFSPAYSVKHPRLGYLDAKRWLRFMYIHTKHHQKQIKRIEKKLGNDLH